MSGLPRPLALLLLLSAGAGCATPPAAPPVVPEADPDPPALFAVSESGRVRMTVIGVQRDVELFFSTMEDLVSVSNSEPLDDEPVAESFYEGTTRPSEHAWTLTDAGSRILVEGAAVSTGHLYLVDYVVDAFDSIPIAYPVTLHWRIPRRWTRTVERFIFEDFPIAEAGAETQTTEPK